MANQEEYIKKLNERKAALVEFFDEYNLLCIKVASELANGLYANLDLRIVQKKVKYFPDVLYGFYSAITVKGRTQRLQDLFHKKATIEGHEDLLRSRGSSYDDLISKISTIFERDMRNNVVRSQDFSELVKKFDSYGFPPSVLVSLAHLLFFERIGHVPEQYEGQHPSYFAALRSFLGNLTYSELSFNDDAPHQIYQELNYWMNFSDVDINTTK